MCSFSEGEMHFNLMAVVGDRRKRFMKEIERLESQRDLAAKMVGCTIKCDDLVCSGVHVLYSLEPLNTTANCYLYMHTVLAKVGKCMNG